MSLQVDLVLAGTRELPDLVDGPDMREAVSGWSRPMVLLVTTISAGAGGDAVKAQRSINADGFLAATTARKLDIKDDGSGTRKWKYWALYVLEDPHVNDGDIIAIDGKTFKVMKSNDRSQHGFFVLGLTEDFQG